MVRRNPDVRKRLAELTGELARERDALRVIDEQRRYLAEVAEDAERRALVADTPLSDRERRVADSDHRRAHREWEETAARVRQLEAEQDHLLERLHASGSGGQLQRGAS